MGRNNSARRSLSLPDLDWMRSTLRLMAVEVQSMQPGGETGRSPTSSANSEFEAAFSRAFKRFASVSPGAARSRTSAPRQRVERTERLAASISAG
jgi:hypothetical protein